VAKNENLQENIVCPFAEHQVDFVELSNRLFEDENTSINKEFGNYINIYAGYVKENDYRKNGSSGGSVTWFANQLLQEKMVDYIVAVQENSNQEIRFNYQIYHLPENNKKASKSKYYPTHLEEVLKFIKENDGRYAIIGLPCFIKGINLLKIKEKIYAERIKYTVSLFCGHLKTTHYLSLLASQFDLNEKQIKHFDFRHKVSGKKASDYATKIIDTNNKIHVKQNNELFGTDWGLGLFKLKACDYCDDIIGETADISFGDAWIHKYEDDFMGNNIVVTRKKELDELIQKNIDNRKLQYEPLTPQDLIDSQAGGFRHRREGLAYRLYLKHRKNIWTPPSRVQPEKISNKKRRKLYKLRMIIQEKSYHTKNYRNATQLKKELKKYIQGIDKIYQPSTWVRFRNKIKNLFK